MQSEEQATSERTSEQLINQGDDLIKKLARTNMMNKITLGMTYMSKETEVPMEHFQDALKANIQITELVIQMIGVTQQQLEELAKEE